MSIEFRCVQCQKLLRTPEGTAGKRVKCPSCGTEMRIPSVSDAPGESTPAPGESGSGGFDATLPHSGSSEGGAGSDASVPPPPPPPQGGSPFAAAPPPPPGGDSENPYQAPLSTDFSDDAAYVPPGSVRPTQIDIGDILNRAWTIYKAQLGPCVIPGLLIMGISIAMSFAINIAILVIAEALNDEAAVAANIGLQIISNVVSLWLNLGMIIYFLKIARGQPAQLGDLFTGGPYLLRGIGAMILFLLVFYLGCLLCIVPGVYFALRYGFFLFSIVDRNVGALESYGASSQITGGNKAQSAR